MSYTCINFPNILYDIELDEEKNRRKHVFIVLRTLKMYLMILI